MPDARHSADQAVTLPKNQRKSICILDEAVVGTVSDGQQGLSTVEGIVNTNRRMRVVYPGCGVSGARANLLDR
jgi:hypothetical protein